MADEAYPAAPGTLEHLLREFADEWMAAGDNMVDLGFRSGVHASVLALRSLLDRLHDPESPVTLAEPNAQDVLNLALQDAPGIGHEYGYGDLAAHLVAALHAEGYAITREALCSRSGGCRG